MNKIEALHNFHDEQFAREWSDKFTPTEERINLFQLILDNLQYDLNKPIKLLELGIGPGYLAEYILSRTTDIIYEGLDFSSAMLEIASMRLDQFDHTMNFTQADLTRADWKKQLINNPTTIVSTWALHDLLSKENIAQVYKAVYTLLPKGGLFINGDFIKPEKSKITYEAGRIKPSEHLKLLNISGFSEVTCLEIFEEDIINPTTSNNYACFKAVK